MKILVPLPCLHADMSRWKPAADHPTSPGPCGWRRPHAGSLRKFHRGKAFRTFRRASPHYECGDKLHKNSAASGWQRLAKCARSFRNSRALTTSFKYASRTRAVASCGKRYGHSVAHAVDIRRPVRAPSAELGNQRRMSRAERFDPPRLYPGGSSRDSG